VTAALLGAIFGALATGGVQTISAWHARKRLAETTLVAIASEIYAICVLIRHQGYLADVAKIVSSIEDGTWDNKTVIIDIRENYFNVFGSLAPSLGILDQNHVFKIVTFYAYCKSAIDSTRADGPFCVGGSPEERAENLINLKASLAIVLSLGDQIAQFPQKPISSLLLVP
jgi:hypothetical protein